MGFALEMSIWNGLGLDWIRNMKIFVDFGLDHKFRIRTGFGLS